MPTLALLAPLSGMLAPLDEVPDPVFAQRMVGDGISIDPVSSCVLAPSDAEVLSVHRAGHALTLRVADGVEVMIHVGLDTVALNGEGFQPRVGAGDRVRAGDPLIEFAADYVATRAASLLTQIIVPESARVHRIQPRSGFVEAGRDVVLELTLTDGAVPEAAPATGATVISQPIVVRHGSGLHARPAAVLARTARGFKSDLRVRRGAAEANAKSVTAIMALEVDHGDQVTLAATGADAAQALGALIPLLESAADAADGAGAPTAPRGGAAPARPIDADPGRLRGIPASPGLAVGHIVQVRPEELPVITAAGEPREERHKLDRAIAGAVDQLQDLRDRLEAQGEIAEAGIFAAHQELLRDPDLVEFAWETIASGSGAAVAWHRAFSRHAERLAGARSAMLAARAADVRDAGRRVLRLLTGDTRPPLAYPANAILVAEDLSPSETASLDRTRVRGFCTITGGATSHVAILARSLDIPAVTGIEERALDVPAGTPAILDGAAGTLKLNPSPEELTRARDALARAAARRSADLEAAALVAATADGHRVEVVANVAGLADAEESVRLGGEGVGLFRSEFLFFDRASPPDEEEQHETYRRVAQALGPSRPLIIRTLDVGGDKPLPYVPIAREANPFLGMRGIRLALERSDLLRTQVRAILRAASHGRVRMMVPMITTLEEWRMVKAMVEQERAALRVGAVPLGIMVEVPAVALMADAFAREVDFFSVGTNDLTQYVLAMDRGHPKLAPYVDALHPAVIRLVDMAARAAHAHGKWIGVCGGLASEPLAIPILVGLEIDELSVSVPAIPAVKAQIRGLRLADCRGLASRALAASTPGDVRALAAGFLEG